MQLTLRIALIIITVIYLYYVLQAIKQKKIKISFSIFWILTGGVLIIALAIPNLITNISRMLGFELTVNMIFCTAIFICFYLIFNLNILLTKENKKNIVLVQELSLLKKRVNEIEKQNEVEEEE